MGQHDKRPPFEKIAADLRARIMCGDIVGQLPSIKELMEAFETKSTSVIQRALELLSAEGLISVHHGRGAFVRSEPQVAVDAAAYIPVSPHGITYRLITVSEAQPPADVARFLGLCDHDLAVMRHRLMLSAGRPLEVSWSFYPLEVASGTELADARLIRGGVPRVLEDLGLTCAAPDDVLSVRMPTTTEAELLEISNGQPILRTLRVVRSTGGRPLEASVLVKTGSRMSVRYRASGA